MLLQADIYYIRIFCPFKSSSVIRSIFSYLSPKFTVFVHSIHRICGLHSTDTISLSDNNIFMSNCLHFGIRYGDDLLVANFQRMTITVRIR